MNLSRRVLFVLLVLTTHVTANANDEPLQIGGVIETELGLVSTDDTDESDIVLATVEIALAKQLNEHVSVEVVLLHEEDDTDFEVDTGVIRIGKEDSGMYLLTGQMFVPFGVFETNMVSDPLTLESNETKESAIQLGWISGNIDASFYLFNGNTIESSNVEDGIEHFGANLSYQSESLQLVGGYINSFADSDAIQELLADSIDTYVAGLSLFAMYSNDNFNIIFEYLTALDKFKTTDFATPTAEEIEPSVTNFEFAWHFKPFTLAVASQMTEDAVDLGLPETKTMLTLSRSVFDHVGLGVELATASDYSTDDGGSGEDTDSITVQLAVEF